MIKDFGKLTIQKTHEGLVKKQFSCRELTSFYLENIREKDQKINAFLAVIEEEAFEQADKIDNLISQNQPLSSLAGIILSVKDVIVTENIKTTAASKILENFIPPYDATVVKKIKEAGGVILGKTNCDEFAMGSSTENSAFKITKNPHDLTRVPGGSSGGSAAAVAAGMGLYSLGSDTGGSVRQPAAFCGVVGLKPTYGRVSRSGLIAMASSLDCLGPITKNVEDAALVLQTIAGYDKYDATTVKREVPNYIRSMKQELRSMRIGLPKEYFGQGVDKKVAETVKKAVKKLENLGAKIEEISLPHTEYALACYHLIMPAEVSTNLARYDGIRYGFERDKFGQEAKRRIILGTFALSHGYYDQYYLKAAQVRTLIRQDFEKAFQKVDVLISPTTPTVAFKIGEKIKDPLQMYMSDILTVPANLAGIPAISVPCGEISGLPVGLQIMGHWFEEEKILQVAYSYEQSNNWT